MECQSGASGAVHYIRTPVGGAYQDLLPENGILATPVIDVATGTMSVVAATWENSKYFYRLHALDLASGRDKFGAPAA